MENNTSPLLLPFELSEPAGYFNAGESGTESNRTPVTD